MDRSKDWNESLGLFLSLLEQKGFLAQEGKMELVDILKLCSEGVVDSCLGNNVGVPYASCFLPPAPEQHAPDPYYLAPGFTYKLRQDEAVVFIGLTPPPVLYYCFRSYLGFMEDKPDNDYSQAILAGSDESGHYHMVFASLGDQLNNYNIWTGRTPKGAIGEPYLCPAIIISTADRKISRQIRDMLFSAGFPMDLMNIDQIPADLVDMGLEKGKDTFLYLMRFALWEDQEAGHQYLEQIDQFLKVFRITPAETPSSLDPWPVPTLKRRETGISEYQVVPSCRADMDHLRLEIIRKYGREGFRAIDLDLGVGIPDNYNAILRDFNVYGDNRDAVYFKTDDFQLTNDEDFLILYGLNHARTGKALYSNASFYGVELFNGVAGAFSTHQFPDSATAYFPEGYESAGYYYVYQMARKAENGNTVIIPYSTGNPLGKAYGVDNHQDVRIVFRVYLDPLAMVGPYLFDLVWDQAILFRKG